MPCLMMFTDASPQEYIRADHHGIWHTMAGIGLIVPNDPIADGILVSGTRGTVRWVAIPDPQRLAEALNPDGRAITRSWKNIRAHRRPAAISELLAACQAGHCVFVSHSTLSHLVNGIATTYLNRFCKGFVYEPGLVGFPRYLVRLPPDGREVFVDEQRLLSLVWVVHCLSIFLQKSRESVGNIPALFVHDNLPFDRPEDVAMVEALLNAQDPGRIFFMTERDQLEFAPVDNLAAVAAAFVEGRDSTIQTWVWKKGRPRNFYMTVDEENGSFVRFI